MVDRGRMVFVIHGSGVHTWWNRTILGGSSWWLPNSAFCSSIKRAIGKDCEIRSFLWSGDLSHKGRLKEAQKLAAEITKACETTRCMIDLVGHSHGGNVALCAVNQLPPKTVSSLVLLANPNMVYLHRTPSRCNARLEFGGEGETGCGGSRCHWLYWGQAPNLVKGQIWNVYSCEDWVQTFVVRWLHGMPRKLKCPGSLAVVRVYLGEFEEKVRNERLRWRTAGVATFLERFHNARNLFAHGAMHCSQMGEVVGHLIKKEEADVSFHQALWKAGLTIDDNEIRDDGFRVS